MSTSSKVFREASGPKATQATLVTAPRRRHWFRFTLRTLFVVMTVLASGFGWLCHEFGIVRARRDFLVKIRGRNESALTTEELRRLTGLPYPGVPRQAMLRRLLGDEWIAVIVLSSRLSTADEIAEGKRLFPEADFVPTESDPGRVPEWFHRFGRETGINGYTGTAYQAECYDQRDSPDVQADRP